MKKVTVYTDGACSGNPGPGGWGAILMYNENKKEISGAEKETTNNIMEITAVLEALKILKEECEVKIYSDSAYVVNAFNQGWIYNWRKNNWKTANKEPVKNKELWEKLYELTQKHKVEFIKVKGHSDNEYNNRCDYLATSAIKTL
ncbi:MAG TPA: ribonuclease HI [Candidatus Scatovivens faecipullorum]|nr:ribonuclease HI [Candidatus Scatovivens faecipullorum]